MELTEEQRIIRIAKALGAGGRTFSVEDVQAVDSYIFDAGVRMALSEMILNGTIFVGIDNCGQIEFSNDPAKFSVKG
jgi:hypothetical protein